MKYGKELYGVSLERDSYAEHFAEPGDVIDNYMVFMNGDCILESENPRELARDLKLVSKRLEVIARFLEKKKK